MVDEIVVYQLYYLGDCEVEELLDEEVEVDDRMVLLHRMVLLKMFVEYIENENVEERISKLQIEHFVEDQSLDLDMYSHRCYLK
jgi:hypothetical protein